MLRKLLKHEFRATARVMIPLYLITVLLAVLTRATALWAEMVTFDGMLGRNFLALLSGIIIFGFVLALIATFVVAVILAILRFRSNLMADEGYVMFTLPVSTHTLVVKADCLRRLVPGGGCGGCPVPAGPGGECGDVLGAG